MQRALLAATAAALVLTPAAAEANTVFFGRGSVGAGCRHGRLTAIERPRAATQAALLQALLHGPSSGERRAGLSSTIPAGTQLERVSVAARTATVRLQRPGARPSWARVGGDDVYGTAQVVYTLTALPSIDRVLLFVNGRHCCMWTMQSRPVQVPLSRATVAGWQGAP